MTAREMLFGDAARDSLLRGADALADAVKVTLGPRGRTVIIERAAGAPQVVNSGVVVARAIELADPFENMGAQLLREVAARTSDMAGDGTTTATVLARAMLRDGLKQLAAGLNPMELKRGIDGAIDCVVRTLKDAAKPCADAHEIAHVAAISANNDAAIGDLVAQALQRVGRDGAVSIEDGSSMESRLEIVEGLQFDHGYLSPYFINDPDRQAAILDDAKVLVCDQRVTSTQDLVALLDAAVKSGSPLLLIAQDFADDVLATLVVNVMGGIIKACAVKAPGFGDQRRALLADIALVTGGQLIAPELGLTLAKATREHLGRAHRVEVDKDATTLIGGAGKPQDVRERVEALRKERVKLGVSPLRAPLDERIAKLSGGVAVIKVGAATETELKERKLRVEDALHAARAAVEEGILPGGGVALLQARRALKALQWPTFDQAAGAGIVAAALEAPLRQIVENAGEEASVVLRVVEDSVEHGFGFDAFTRQYANLFERGVVDPVKVTRLALQNAGSIMGLMLTTDCLIAPEPAPPAHTGLGGLRAPGF